MSAWAYLVVALVGIAGAAAGFVAGVVVAERRFENRPEARRAESDAALAVEVVRRSATGYLVLDAEGHTELANDRASELGALRAGVIDEAIADAADRTRVSGEPIDVKLNPPPALPNLAGVITRTPTAVTAIVQAVDGGRVLVSVTDESAARRVEDVRRDFIANVSHELKTPVSSMGLLAEAALDASDDPEAVRHFVAKLHSESVRLGTLVNELISLSRLQGAEPLLDLVPVEIDGVVDEALNRVATRAEASGITLASDGPSGLVVRGDRTLLVTALTNLIDNAVQYSPAGTPVSISRAQRDGMVRLAVTDRGIGISGENQRRIFERFFRVDPARSRATGGTGLGLAIVKHIAANHGGTATVWSRPGTGSTFTLILPVLTAPRSAPGPAGVPADPSPGSSLSPLGGV
ncbi:sensor histidine kinase [Nakamurella flava]|uniref:sensor histidine kinase n=1 Tax=Nakamurella flava TaxID=2576308 RepID=UPI001F1065DF|nr:ATP-binding protein [Nakamurella flava]